MLQSGDILLQGYTLNTVIGKILANTDRRKKIFRDNNIGGTKMPSYSQQEGILVPPILFPQIYLSAKFLSKLKSMNTVININF
jgi:hypothetical protein